MPNLKSFFALQPKVTTDPQVVSISEFKAAGVPVPKKPGKQGVQLSDLPMEQQKAILRVRESAE